MNHAEKIYSDYRELGAKMQKLSIELIRCKGTLLKLMGRKHSLKVGKDLFLIRKKVHVNEHFVSAYDYVCLKEKTLVSNEETK